MDIATRAYFLAKIKQWRDRRTEAQHRARQVALGPTPTPDEISRSMERWDEIKHTVPE